MAEVTTAAWLAGRSKFYGGIANGKSEDQAKAEAIIAEFETMHGVFATQGERDKAIAQALAAVEAQSGQRSWLF